MTKMRCRIREIHGGETIFRVPRGWFQMIKRTGGYGDEETGRICGEYT